MSTHTPARNDDAPRWAASGVPVHPLTGGSPPRRPQPSAAMTWGRSTVVRMPGGAAQTTGTALTARWAV